MANSVRFCPRELLLFVVMFFAQICSARNLTVQWDPGDLLADGSADTNVVSYRLYFGTASSTYNAFVGVDAPATQATISNVVRGTKYYLSATAVSADDIESDYATEITYTLTNALPVPTALSLSTLEDTSVLINFRATDLDNDPLTFGIVSGPANGTLSGSGSGRTYTPRKDFFGADQFVYSVSDGFGTVTAVVSINVAAVNDAPTLNTLSDMIVGMNSGARAVTLSGITTGATNEVQTLSITAVSSNPTLVPNPAVTYISPNSSGALSFTPAPNQLGAATITVTVKDNGASNNVVSRSFKVTVGAPPVISNLTRTANDARSLSFSWNTDQAATCYIEYGITTTLGMRSASTGMATSHAMTLTNLDPATTYYLRVTASSTTGSSTFVSSDATEPVQVLSIPAESGFVASPMAIVTNSLAQNGAYIVSSNSTSGAVTYLFNVPRGLSYRLWSRVKVAPGGATISNQIDGATSINMFAGDNGATNQWHWALLSAAAATTNAALLKLDAGAHYIYLTPANSSLQLDELVIVNDPKWQPVLPTTKPTLTAVRSTSGTATLSWNDPSGNATQMQIEFSTDGVNFSKLSTVAASTTSAAFTVSAQVFYFRVFSYNSVDRTGYSNTAMIPAQ